MSIYEDFMVSLSTTILVYEESAAAYKKQAIAIIDVAVQDSEEPIAKHTDVILEVAFELAATIAEATEKLKTLHSLLKEKGSF